MPRKYRMWGRRLRALIKNGDHPQAKQWVKEAGSWASCAIGENKERLMSHGHQFEPGWNGLLYAPEYGPLWHLGVEFHKEMLSHRYRAALKIYEQILEYADKNLFDHAATVAIRKCDNRTFLVGAVGVRRDGTIVASSNILTKDRNKYAHAESRLSRKLDMGSTVYVARVSRTGIYRMARPCADCQLQLMRRGVRVVYYTINEREYGVIRLHH